MHLGCICSGQSHTLAHYAALLAQIRRSESEAENERKNDAECERKRVFRSKTHTQIESERKKKNPNAHLFSGQVSCVPVLF